MAFVLELKFVSKQQYIKNYIVAIARQFNIKTDVKFKDDILSFAFESEHEKLQECLDLIAKTLPASLFLKSSKSYVDNDITPTALPTIENEYTLNLGICPSCQKEMLDVSSKRYYYPFTSCVACGGNYSFLTSYPYERKNTSFRFLVPCKSCQEEMQNVGKNEHHHINSCNECGVPVRLKNKTSERYANDAGSFRTMFEVAAKAINDGKKVLIKTTMGYRVFYKSEFLNNDSILMMINSSKITDHLSLITEEFNALLSIERPVLYVTLKNEKLKELSKANTAFVKYPDDGFSILLGVELQKLGIDFIAYEEADENTETDFIMDYDLDINPQTEMQFFINKDTQFVANGTRVSYPCADFETKSVVSITDDIVALPKDNKMMFDTMKHFDGVDVLKANVLDGIDKKYHSNQSIMLEDESAFLATIADNNKLDKKCVGAYFADEPSFLYYDGKNVVRVVPPKNFDSSNLLENIASLRDGSDRLVQNLQKTLPDVYEKLQNLSTRDDVTLFEAVAIILGLEDESLRGVTKEAMKFVGKGGIQIDTHVKDNRFDHIAFLSSIISYQLAGVSTSILSYSIFESFGDYFNDILQELRSKTKADEFVLCGSTFANQSLFSRMQRNLKITPPLMSLHYPIGKESCVVGGVFM